MDSYDLGSSPSNFMNFLFLISFLLPANLWEMKIKQNKTKQNKFALSQIRDWLQRQAVLAENPKGMFLAVSFGGLVIQC